MDELPIEVLTIILDYARGNIHTSRVCILWRDIITRHKERYTSKKSITGMIASCRHKCKETVKRALCNADIAGFVVTIEDDSIRINFSTFLGMFLFRYNFRGNLIGILIHDEYTRYIDWHSYTSAISRDSIIHHFKNNIVLANTFTRVYDALSECI